MRSYPSSVEASVSWATLLSKFCLARIFNSYWYCLGCCGFVVLLVQLPLFASLCLDSAADVREECSRALVVIAQAAAASRAPGNMGIVVRAVEGLAADVSRLLVLCL